MLLVLVLNVVVRWETTPLNASEKFTTHLKKTKAWAVESQDFLANWLADEEYGKFMLFFLSFAC
jgi:hypothetical protein